MIHREFTNRQPARLIIERGHIFTENGNITLNETGPYSKNPTIAKIFRTIGLADELGSGFHKINRYAEAYAGSKPTLNDSDVFTFDWKTNLYRDIDPTTGDIMMLSPDSGRAAALAEGGVPMESDQASGKAETSTELKKSNSDQVSDQVDSILDYCKIPRTLQEIMNNLGYSNKTYFRRSILTPLIQKGLLEYTEPNSPKHPRQKYRTINNNPKEQTHNVL